MNSDHVETSSTANLEMEWKYATTTRWSFGQRLVVGIIGASVLLCLILSIIALSQATSETEDVPRYVGGHDKMVFDDRLPSLQRQFNRTFEKHDTEKERKLAEMNSSIRAVDDKVENTFEQLQAYVELLHRQAETTRPTTRIGHTTAWPQSTASQTTTRRRASTCPSSYYVMNPYSQTCYRLVSSLKTWPEAKTYCENAGEHLVTFRTLAAANWYNTYTLTRWGNYLWIGLRANSTDWFWSGMSTEEQDSSINFWSPGHPYNITSSPRCAYADDEKWFDFNCGYHNRFVCEAIPGATHSQEGVNLPYYYPRI